MTATAQRPSHLRWGPLGLVALGGVVGVSARETVSLLIPDLGALPVSILIVNVAGAFFLGYLYEAVTRLDVGDSRAKRLKLLLGTGFCGGFTTYSSLATDIVVLNSTGHLALAVAYALGTVVIGALATWAGIVLAARANARRTAPGPDTSISVPQ